MLWIDTHSKLHKGTRTASDGLLVEWTEVGAVSHYCLASACRIAGRACWVLSCLWHLDSVDELTVLHLCWHLLQSSQLLTLVAAMSGQHSGAGGNAGAGSAAKGEWTGGREYQFDTAQHIEAGLRNIEIGKGFRAEALDARSASEMARLATLSKAKLVEAVGHLMAALTDPGLPESHQKLLRDEVIRYGCSKCCGWMEVLCVHKRDAEAWCRYLDIGEEMYDLAKSAAGDEANEAQVEYDKTEAYTKRTVGGTTAA